jgi:hypothetical protein
MNLKIAILMVIALVIVPACAGIALAFDVKSEYLRGIDLASQI